MMVFFLVCRIQGEHIELYKLFAQDPEAALFKSIKEQPFAQYKYNGIYGEGGIAVPYSEIDRYKVIAQFVKTFLDLNVKFSFKPDENNTTQKLTKAY